MATTQEIELHVFDAQSSHDRYEDSARDPPNTEHEDSQQPAEDDWRPTRKYQAVLLAAGFAMIFHVIGINSIYGIFQVNLPIPMRPDCLTPSYRSSTPLLTRISKMPLGRMR